MRLITVDRPGYGRSDPLPGRTLLGWPDDVEQLLDALSIDRCAIVGASAGGPHALACGVRLPHRVTRLGCVGTPGPVFHVAGLWELLDEEWRAALDEGARDPSAAIGEARRRSQWLADDPAVVADPASWDEIDRWLAEDPSMRAPLMTFVREAARQGVDGYAWDRLACVLPWGFTPSDVSIDVWLWHGELDPIIERAEFEQLCAELPRPHPTLYPGQGHLLRGNWGDVFETLTAGSGDRLDVETE